MDIARPGPISGLVVAGSPDSWPKKKPHFVKRPIPIVASVSEAKLGYAGTYPDGPGMCRRIPL